MIRDIELIYSDPTFRNKLGPPSFVTLQQPASLTYLNYRPKNGNFDCYICEDENHRLFFIPALAEFRNDIAELQKKFRQYANIYKTSYKHYKELFDNHTITVRPVIDMSEREINQNAVTDGLWQTACALTVAHSASTDAWNVGTQIGFPLGLSMIAAAMRGFYYCSEYERKHGVPPPPAIKKAIVKDCAAFSAKLAISMGAWELGYFCGQCILTACSVTPFTLWVPVVLSICAGVFQGVFSVLGTIADEKRKYGEVRSNAFDLAKTFISSFVSGAVWQMCSYIPFGGLIAKSFIKPVAEIVGSILVGAATAISSYCVAKLVPKVMDSLSLLFSKSTTSQTSKKNNENKPIKNAEKHDKPIVDSKNKSEERVNPMPNVKPAK